MVAARPFFIGSPGCVRSSACTWLFSSQHSTKACSGGDTYSPTMSSSFSTNFGSREILNVLTKCGFRPLAPRYAAHSYRSPRLFGQAGACTNGSPPPVSSASSAARSRPHRSVACVRCVEDRAQSPGARPARSGYANGQPGGGRCRALPRSLDCPCRRCASVSSMLRAVRIVSPSKIWISDRTGNGWFY